jgi:hypothetical protein
LSKGYFRYAISNPKYLSFYRAYKFNSLQCVHATSSKNARSMSKLATHGAKIRNFDIARVNLKKKKIVQGGKSNLGNFEGSKQLFTLLFMAP